VSLRWDQGRGTIEAMLGSGALEQVPASREHADLLLAHARQHLASARVIAATDPEGGYAMVYDAARKALSAVLANQGLRTTSLRGHHQAAYDAVLTQLDPPMGRDLRPFLRLKQARGSAEYPKRDELPLAPDDVLEDCVKAGRIVDICTKVLDAMPVFVPGS
jgi:hypothetical protein